MMDKVFQKIVNLIVFLSFVFLTWWSAEKAWEYGSLWFAVLCALSAFAVVNISDYIVRR